MKRFYKITSLSLFFIFSTINISFCITSENQITNIAPSILFDLNKNQILHKKNVTEIHEFPYLSKLMTCLIAIEKCDLEEMITIGKDSSIKDSALNLEIGEKYPLKDLIKIALFNDSNEATLAIANYIDSNKNQFVKLMNSKCTELDMKSTRFTSPDGKSNPDQCTNISDFYKFIIHALNNPYFMNYFTTKADPLIHNNISTLLVNPNKLFLRYDKTKGGLLSEIDKKSIILTYASKDDLKLFAIIFDNTSSVLANTEKLLEYGFDNFTTQSLLSKNEVIYSTKIDNTNVDLVSKTDALYTHPLNEYYVKSVEYNLNPNLKLPIKKDLSIGVVKYTLKDSTVFEFPIYSNKNLYPKDDIFVYFINKILENSHLAVFLVILILIEIILGSIKLHNYFLVKKTNLTQILKKHFIKKDKDYI